MYEKITRNEGKWSWGDYGRLHRAVRACPDCCGPQFGLQEWCGQLEKEDMTLLFSNRRECGVGQELPSSSILLYHLSSIFPSFPSSVSCLYLSSFFKWDVSTCLCPKGSEPKHRGELIMWETGRFQGQLQECFRDTAGGEKWGFLLMVTGEMVRDLLSVWSSVLRMWDATISWKWGGGGSVGFSERWRYVVVFWLGGRNKLPRAVYSQIVWNCWHAGLVTVCGSLWGCYDLAQVFREWLTNVLEIFNIGKD